MVVARLKPNDSVSIEGPWYTMRLVEFPLDVRVEDMGLSARSRNAITRLLEERGMPNTLSSLCSLTEKDLLMYRSFGRTSLREVRRNLSDRGCSLAGPITVST